MKYKEKKFQKQNPENNEKCARGIRHGLAHHNCVYLICVLPF